MEEQWVPCYETDDYEASTEGRVRNAKTGRILKTHVNKHGKEIVSIQVNGKQRTRRVSRLVGEAFYREECIGKDVYHRDSDGTKNQLSNLAIGTRSDAIKNTYNNGRKQTHCMRPVRCIETGEEYGSITECSSATGISAQAISRCVNNPFLHTEDGYHFVDIE